MLSCSAINQPNSAVIGLGVDLVEIGRMQRLLENRTAERFKTRVFLKAEREYCDSRPKPCLHYAARFAAKEAVAKAFGTGIGALLGWRDIEVARNPQSGAVFVRLSVKARRLAARRKIGRILLSLAHTGQLAMAQVILAGKNSSGGCQ